MSDFARVFYSVDGVSLNDAAGRWELERGTGRRSLPAVRATQVSTPGRHGSAFIANDPYEVTSLGISLIVTDNDEFGVAAGPLQAERNVELLTALFEGAGRLLRVEHHLSALESRVAYGRVTAGSNPVMPGLRVLEYRLHFVVEIPSVFWSDGRGFQFTQSAAPSASGTLHLPVLDGGSAPVTDAVIRFAGPFNGKAGVADVGGGAAYAWSGTPDASTSTMSTAAGTVTNLATNPSFEATSGTVEVWRNKYRRPLMDSTIGIGSANGGTFSRDVDGEIIISTPGAGEPFGDTRDSGVNFASNVEPFEVGLYRFSVTLTGTDQDESWCLLVSSTGGTIVASTRSPHTLVRAGETKEISLDFEVVGPGVPAMYLLRSTINVSRSVRVSKVKVTTAATVYTPWDDPDLTLTWTGTANASASVLTATRAAGTGVGWQSKKWAATGESSHYIPQGSVQEYVIGEGESFQIQPRNAGQTYLVNGDPHVTTAGHTIRVNGPAMIEVGEGWWDNRMHTDKPYTGAYWDGSTPSTVGTDPTGLSYQGNVSAGSYVFLNADTLRAHTSTNKEAWDTGTDVSGNLDYPPAGPLQITPSAQADGTHYAVNYTLPAAKNTPDAVGVRAERKFI